MISLWMYFLSIFCMNANQSNIDCSALKEGKFKSAIKLEDGSPFTTIITRKKNLQYEEILEYNVKAVFKVQWVSDCTYNLIEPKVIKGRYPALTPDLKLQVTIIGINDDGYRVSITSSSYEGEKEFKLYYNK